MRLKRKAKKAPHRVGRGVLQMMGMRPLQLRYKQAIPIHMARHSGVNSVPNIRSLCTVYIYVCV